jgi:hypothetical protein
MAIEQSPCHKTVLAFSIIFFSMSTFADDRGRSIMFGDKPGMDTNHSVGTSHTPLETLQKPDDRCSRLAKEIETLKGKPQRRYVAQQRFNQECRRGVDNE